MNNRVQGSCLCEGVAFEVSEFHGNVGACHCNMCRKWGGGPLLAIECKENVIFSNDDLVSIFSSSDWAERGFCSKCGSHLFYKLKDRSDYYIPAGLLNSDIQLNFDHQVFIDEKPSYYCFSNETRNRTGAEIFAEFGG